MSNFFKKQLKNVKQICNTQALKKKNLVWITLNGKVSFSSYGHFIIYLSKRMILSASLKCVIHDVIRML